MDRLHEEVIQSRKPNRQGNDFLRYAETTMIQIDKPRRNNSIKMASSYVITHYSLLSPSIFVIFNDIVFSNNIIFEIYIFFEIRS
jgi:hypothetical protein